MRRNDCIIDCVGPDCEGCREYKPKPEEILEKYFPIVIADEDEWAIHVCKAMQEYAEEYHKEKLKDELVKFTIFISKMDYKDAAAERVINEYLEIIE